MPADIDPSPITAIARPGWSLSLFATAKPSAALIEVDECAAPKGSYRSEEHTSELQSLMSISYAVFCLKKKIRPPQLTTTPTPANTGYRPTAHRTKRINK